MGCQSLRQEWISDEEQGQQKDFICGVRALKTNWTSVQEQVMQDFICGLSMSQARVDINTRNLVGADPVMGGGGGGGGKPLF